MSYNNFEEKLNYLNEKFKKINVRRIVSSYEDINNIHSLLISIGVKLTNIDMFNLAITNPEKFYKAKKEESKVITLLKTLYVFTDIFVNIFLQEITGGGAIRNSTELLIKNYLSNHFDGDINKKNNLLDIYCTVIYRNKIIIHQDIYRLNGIKTSSKGEIRMIPLLGGEGGVSFDIGEQTVEKIIDLKQNYGSVIANLDKTENVFDILNLLFYGIPINCNGKFNPDRKLINELIEKGGCESKSYNQIAIYIDSFVNQILDNFISTFKNQSESS